MRARRALLFTAAFGAGLATGLLHFPGTTGASVVLAAALLAAWRLRRGLPLLLALAAALGRSDGELARRTAGASCAARLPTGRSVRLTVRMLEPVDREGGRVRIAPLGCPGEIAARWPAAAPADAGTTVLVEGTWLARGGAGGRAWGTLVVQHPGAPDQPVGLAARLRTAIAAESRRLYGSRAPLVDALVLGTRGGIDPVLQNGFARSGLVHLLSISGFHVGLIGGWVALCARLAGARRERALMVAAAVSIAYVAFLGWPAPATRAAALAAMLARCRLAQRNVRADELLAATCLVVLLVDPWAVLDLGGWLSAAALWGAMRFGRWTDGALGRHGLWRMLGSSVGATLATAPITAWSLGTVAPIGVVLNFAAIPLAAIAVPGVLASLLVAPLVRPVAQAFAAGSGLMLHLLELLARGGAAVPLGHLIVEPGELSVCVTWLGLLAAGLWITQPANRVAEAARRAGWTTAAVLWLGLAPAVLPFVEAGLAADGARGLALHFLDVGQGDAAALRTPAGHWVLIDAGPAGTGADAGRRVVAPFLERHGARALSLAVVSHAHADHLGGLPAVLSELRSGLVIEPGADVPDPRYIEFLGSLARERIAWHPAHAGERFLLDSVRFTVLHPTPGWQAWGEDVNEDSLVLLVEYGDFQALFAGDAGFPAEADMLRSGVTGGATPAPGEVDLLKVGHHGSRGSTGDDWLAALHPRVAVISLGRNDYGHPAAATLDRLRAHGVVVHRTDREGTITVRTDGRTMLVKSDSGSATSDVR